jgi:PAS domain S-box-containing protein
MEWKLSSGQGYFLKRNELKRSVKKSALVIMAIVTLISVLGFIGWIFDIDILKRPARHLVAINPVTSFALSLCAISFALILFKKNESRRNRMIGLFSVLIALTISLLRVLELAFNVGFGIDYFLFKFHIFNSAEYSSSKMGMLASVAIAMIACAILLTRSSNYKHLRIANFLALVVFVLSVFSITGYIYRVKEFYLIDIYSPMSIQTAITLFMFSIILMTYNSKSAFMGTLSSKYVGGIMARVLLPFILVMPIVLGLVGLTMYNAYFSSVELAVALVIMALCGFFFLFTWYLSRLLNITDIERRETAEKLRVLNLQLEDTVQQRTAELLKSEIRFKAVVENNFDAVSFLTKDLELQYRSPAAQRITGWTEDERKNNDSLITVHPEDINIVVQARQEALRRPGIPVRATFRNLHRDGHYIWLDTIFNNQLHNNDLKSLVVTFRDITPQKEAEEKLIKSNRLYAFISQINQTIVQVKDQKILFERVCNIAIEYGKFHSVWIALMKEEGVLSCLNHRGMDDDNLWKYTEIDYNDEALWPQLYSQVFRNGEYFLQNKYDFEADESICCQDAKQLGYKSSVIFPLKESGRTVGCICFNAPTEDFFDESEIALLSEAVGDISFALDLFVNEKKHAKTEEQRRLNETRLKKAQQIARLGSWEVDLETGTTIWSEEVYRLIGIPINSLKDIRIDTILEYIQPDDVALVKETIHNSKVGSTSAIYYRIVRRKDGRIRYVYTESRYEYDLYDNPVRVLGIIYDITESREAEMKLAISEQRFRALIENNFDAIILLDRNWHVTYSSPSLSRIVGVRETARLSFDAVLSSIAKEDRYKVVSVINKAKRNPHTPLHLDFRIRHPEGHYIWLEGLVNNLLGDSNIKGYLINLHDITQAKRSEAALRILNDRLEQKVDERTKDVKRAFENLRYKQMQITDSLNYAKRIQKAILPTEMDLAKSFPNHFVYFKPASIVSGDFYWHYKTDKLHYIAAVDCTGHGVPGAFMSIIGHELLNRAVSEYKLKDPAEILRFVDQGLFSALHLRNEQSDLNDGMDIILCVIETDLQVVSYCSALRPLFYTSENTLREIEASRISLGANKSGKEKVFETQYILYNHGDRIYLTSDGYYAQFGGDRGKKIGKKQFKQILQEFTHVPISEQKAMLNFYFNQWKANEEQVDDVLVIGIEL